MSTSARNPFPGPVPLTESQGSLLFGRASEKDELMMRLRPGSALKIIQLTADSGIGKTSLLDAGLVPRLVDGGRTVVLIRDWSAVSGRSGVDNLAEALMNGLGRAVCEDMGLEQLREGTGSEPGNAEEIVDEIDDFFGEDLVVILDQFEELFRLDPSLGHEFLGALVERYARRSPLSFRTIVSLRSEYRAELGLIESKLSTDRWLWYPLDHVEDQVVADLITAGLPPEQRPFGADEAEVLKDLWVLAAYGATAQNRGKWWKPRVGLLQMQAMLWVLWERLRGDSQVKLSWQSTLAALGVTTSSERQELTPSELERGATAAFQAALRAYLDEAFDELMLRAGDGSASRGHDRLVGERRARETRVMAALLAPALSSGGYKQVVDTEKLALTRTAVGFQYLDKADEKEYARSAIRRARDVAEAEGSRFICFSQLEDDYSLLLGEPDVEFDVQTVGGDQGLGSGRVMTLHWQVVTAEIAVTYERALQWLKKRQIVRLTPGPWRDGYRTRAVSVTHDGYGDPLDAWGRYELTKPSTYEHMLMALRGETIEIPDGIKATSDGSPVVLRRLCWQGAEIAFDLANVVFEECDLRGSIIQDVEHMEDVEFRNCVTDGLLIQRSKISGARGLRFVVDSSSLAPELAAADVFDTSVSTLTLQNRCVFTEGTPLVFRGLEGYGIFVTETTGAAWSIVDCRLDHVLIGSDVKMGGDWTLHSGMIVNAFLSHLVLRGRYSVGGAGVRSGELDRVAERLGVSPMDLGITAEQLDESMTVRVANASLVHVEAQRVKLSGDWIWLWRDQKQFPE
ncbi:MAG: hypothetical protein WCF36_19555 [Candidatus Nanopelagicales bacterium]